MYKYSSESYLESRKLRHVSYNIFVLNAILNLIRRKLKEAHYA